jgi:PAS domain S-box-containing protein
MVGAIALLLATAHGSPSRGAALAPTAASRPPFWQSSPLPFLAGLLIVTCGLATAWRVSRRPERPAPNPDEPAPRTESRYETFWKNAEASLFVVRVIGKDRFVIEALNPAHERLTGLRSRDLAGRDPRDGFPPDVAEALVANYARCVKERRPIRYDEELALPGGRRHWVTTLVPVPEPDGVRIGLIVGTAVDVTAERAAQDAAKRDHELLQGTVDALPAHLAILDRDGTIIQVNEAWHRFATENGYSHPAHGIGLNYIDVCRDSRTQEGAIVAQRLSALLAGAGRPFRLSYRLDTLHGERSFLLRAARFERAGVVHGVITHEDVTELTLARRSLDELGERLLALQEDERRRIASELHDSTAQHLVAASLTLMHARALLADDAQAQRALETVEASLNEAQREIRVFTYLLYPQVLETDGLRATLRSFIAGFSRRTGLHAHVVIAREVDSLPKEVQRAVLRIVQEALANVHRHANASRVSVHLRANRRGLLLSVRDDGRGFKPDPQHHPTGGPATGVGLPGMRTRVSQFGGRLRILSGQGGTTLRAFIPREDRPSKVEG